MTRGKRPSQHPQSPRTSESPTATEIAQQSRLRELCPYTMARLEELTSPISRLQDSTMVCDEAHKLSATFFDGEIVFSLNQPDDFIPAMVRFNGDGSHEVRNLRRPFRQEPDFGVTSVNYDLEELLRRADAPK